MCDTGDNAIPNQRKPGKNTTTVRMMGTCTLLREKLMELVSGSLSRCMQREGRTVA